MAKPFDLRASITSHPSSGLPADIAGELEERIYLSTLKGPGYQHAPDLTDLIEVYKKASKEDLIHAITVCASYICHGARNSIGREIDVDAAKALFVKWYMFHDDEVLKGQSMDELRYVLAAGYKDAEAFLEDEGGEKLTVKPGSGKPEPGRWSTVQSE